LEFVNEDPLPLPTMSSSSSSLSSLVDIGINLTHRTFRKNWQDVVQRAMDAGVSRMILTGTSMRTSRESIQLAKTWYNNNDGAVKQKKKKKNLFCTVGIHPHDAKSFEAKDNKTIREMRSLIQASKSLVVAIGECGIDFDRNYSSRDDQLLAFRQQVLLAIEMQMPLFVHERNAHEDLVRVLDNIQAATAAPRRPPLPPIVVHCFTGTHTTRRRPILHVATTLALPVPFVNPIAANRCAITSCRAFRWSAFCWKRMLPSCPISRDNATANQRMWSAWPSK
jgi:Tat protein secretion system quality control protein TatD with DNase activity